jgi:hypothetical protein
MDAANWDGVAAGELAAGCADLADPAPRSWDNFAACGE